jgi:hypothetical protein
MKVSEKKPLNEIDGLEDILEPILWNWK